MSDYVIVCRSLTYAQRGVRVLTMAGFSGNIRRTPSEIAKEGCSYSIFLRKADIGYAVYLLRRSGIEPRKVYKYSNGGSLEEVTL